MLKSCKYCGRIHDSKYVCPRKPKKNKHKEVTEEDKFRNTYSWQKKRDDIKERDMYMCQVCIRKLYNTLKQYNYRDIQVHHIVPIKEDYELRLKDDNLISLCKQHHELAEKGEIPRNILRGFILAPPR